MSNAENIGSNDNNDSYESIKSEVLGWTDVPIQAEATPETSAPEPPTDPPEGIPNPTPAGERKKAGFTRYQKIGAAALAAVMLAGGITIYEFTKNSKNNNP